MADFEGQQPIIVIIIYSFYFLKDLAEVIEYILGITAISSSFYVSYKQLSFCLSVELEHVFYFDQAPRNNATSLTTCTCTLHCHVSDTNSWKPIIGMALLYRGSHISKTA